MAGGSVGGNEALVDELVDSIACNAYAVVKDDVHVCDTLRPECVDDDTFDDYCKESDGVDDHADEAADDEVTMLPKVKNAWPFRHEEYLLGLLEDTYHEFSVHELVRIRNVVALLPSRFHVDLEGIRDALLYNPMLADFADAYVAPNLQTRKEDGTLSKNRVGNSARHGRIALAVCIALDRIIASRRVDDAFSC